MKRKIQFNNITTCKKNTLFNIGMGWTIEEERRLINRFHRGIDVYMLCRIHRRDVGGILSRLMKLDLIDINRCKNGYVHFKTRKRFVSFCDVKNIKIKINEWCESRWASAKTK